MSADNILLFFHLLSAFWYVMGLTAVQMSLLRGWQSEDVADQAEALNEASRYQGTLLIPGATAGAATGLFLWAQMDYNPLRTGWLLTLEALFVINLLVLLPLVGIGLRGARIAALQSRKAGRRTPELEQVMSENVPLVFTGLATLLVPVMLALSVFRPF